MIAHGDFGRGDLAGVDAGVVPEDGLRPGDAPVGDMQRPAGRSRCRARGGCRSRGGSCTTSCRCLPSRPAWDSGRDLLVEVGLHLLDGLVAAIESIRTIAVEEVRGVDTSGFLVVDFNA